MQQPLRSIHQHAKQPQSKPPTQPAPQPIPLPTQPAPQPIPPPMQPAPQGPNPLRPIQAPILDQIHVSSQGQYQGPDQTLIKSILQSDSKPNINLDTSYMGEGFNLTQKTPDTDIYETNSVYRIVVDVPGFNIGDLRDSLQLKCENGLLTIDGRRENTLNGIRRKERSSHFNRNIPLPEAINIERARTKIENGVLEVWIPKMTLSESEYYNSLNGSW